MTQNLQSRFPIPNAVRALEKHVPKKWTSFSDLMNQMSDIQFVAVISFMIFTIFLIAALIIKCGPDYSVDLHFEKCMEAQLTHTCPDASMKNVVKWCKEYADNIKADNLFEQE